MYKINVDTRDAQIRLCIKNTAQKTKKIRPEAIRKAIGAPVYAEKILEVYVIFEHLLCHLLKLDIIYRFMYDLPYGH